MKKLNKILGEVVLVSPLFVISIFMDLWSECLILVMLLFIYKSLYPEQYHADKNYICIAISYTTIILGLVIAYVFKREYLIFILAANVISFASARIGSMQTKSKQYELIAAPYQQLCEYYKETTAPKPFSLDTCTENELIERCNQLRFSEDNTNLAVEFFIKKTKQSVIADRLSINEKSVCVKKRRMKDILTKM